MDKDNYIVDFSEKYSINNKEYILSSTYLPPYNFEKEYTICEIKNTNMGIPYFYEIFRSNDLDKCFLEIERLKKN